ncbi:O-antigen ligase family protein [Tropicimonas sediminicola]|uniref:O-antigen ligase family protein n=1 Tax=Tropicimonas sediminicola TaxID=1031541 RepID=UPI001595FA76|nr:O-antigen ligase family protein [Tropicimonas sediminicola]
MSRGRPEVLWRQLAQATVGWAALALVLAVAFLNGGITPIAWVVLYAGILLLFAFQLVLDLATEVPLPARRVLPVGILYFAALVWLQVQTVGGMAEPLAHPIWQIAPGGGGQSISARPELGQQVVLRLTCYAMIFWVILRSAGSGALATDFIRAIAIFSMVLAVYGIQAQVSGVNPLIGSEVEGNAVRASFTNRNSYATYAAFGVLANFAAYTGITAGGEGGTALASLRNFLERFFAGGWLFGLGGLICLAALILTGSRAGGASGLIGVLVFALALRSPKGGNMRMVWAMVAAIAAFVLLTSSGFLLERLETTGPDLRFEVYPYVVEGALDRPLLGHGAGAFHDTFRAYVPLVAAGAGEWAMAHSSYLENAYEFGLPAAAAFYLALGMIGWRLMLGVLRRRRNRVVPAFALACFVVAALHSLVDFSLQIPAVPAAFAAILGLGWAQSFSSSELDRGSGRRKRSGA